MLATLLRITGSRYNGAENYGKPQRIVYQSILLAPQKRPFYEAIGGQLQRGFITLLHAFYWCLMNQ